MLGIIKKLGLILTLSGLAVSGAQGLAKGNIDQLKLECGGIYTVEVSTPFYIPPQGRAMARSGLNEKIKILSVEGKDCLKIKNNYGIEVSVGQSLNIVSGSQLESKALSQLSKARLGQSFEFEATQTFKYATKSGSLPLFPTVHEEWVNILGKTGKADSAALYSTPDFSSLTDRQLMSVLQESIWQIEWGKKYQGYNGAFGDVWVSLIVETTQKEEKNIKQHLTDLVNVFKNISRFSGSFVSYHPGVLIGQKVNSMLNEHGTTKWSTKLQVFKANPLLFEDQIVGWSFMTKGTTAPSLTANEVDDFLAHALEVCKNLAKVPQVLEARYLLSQYKEAAKSIKLHDGETNGKLKLYELGESANKLVAEILLVKF